MIQGWPISNVSKVRAFYSSSDNLIRKIFFRVVLGQSLVRGISKDHQNRSSFFRTNVHFRVLHPFNMPGSHPLSATLVWPIKGSIPGELSFAANSRELHANRPTTDTPPNSSEHLWEYAERSPEFARVRSYSTANWQMVR